MRIATIGQVETWTVMCIAGKKTLKLVAVVMWIAVNIPTFSSTNLKPLQTGLSDIYL